MPASNALKKLFCKVFRPDWLFGFFLLAFMGLAFKEVFFADDDNAKGIFLSGAIVVCAVVAALGSRFDRKVIEDYYYQIIAHAAIIGAITTIFVIGIFDVFNDRLPPLEASDVLFVLMGGWAIGYVYYRWRGFNS